MRVIFFIIFVVAFIVGTTLSSDAKVKKKKRKVKYAKSKFELIDDTLLHNGLYYEKYLYTIRGAKIQCNVLKVNLKSDDIKVEVLKAGNNISTNSKIRELINYQDSLDNKETIAAVNGNFWKAYTNYPIGALIRAGKAVEIKPYKEWSSFFIDNNNKPYIDNFKLSCQVLFPNGTRIFISDFNKRRDSNSIILYNSYGGDIIPYIKEKDVKQMYDQLLYEQAVLETFNDATEVSIDYNALKEAIIEKNRSELFENQLYKMKLRLLSDETINTPFKAVVSLIDTGSIALQENEIILSFGLLYPDFAFPKVGDTLQIDINTNINKNINFREGITGTPRLVRKGIAKHEAYIEGSKSKRFINHRLPRTAIGYDKNKEHLFIVTISGRNSLSNSKGASLQELAVIMKNIGCWDAMNLDGGGSTMMVINDENIENPAITDLMRKINTVVAVRYNKK
ncbi:MAG TPA: phosphodiester glycosidase family protein [Candidatus Kapabacteria bacterium]|nr:phosphodiester glycosidase family protein [Candidatus Kapabacteria bacterium]